MDRPWAWTHQPGRHLGEVIVRCSQVIQWRVSECVNIIRLEGKYVIILSLALDIKQNYTRKWLSSSYAPHLSIIVNPFYSPLS